MWNQIQEESEETARALEVYCLPCGIGDTSCTAPCARRLPFWPRREAGKGEQGVGLLSCFSPDPSGECSEGTEETKI